MSSALERALDGITGPERIARAAGVIARHAREAGVEPVVVSGGAAVILATNADFATLDIDIVTDDADRLDGVLTDLGFVRRNTFQHIWAHPHMRIAVQVPASHLPPHSAVDDIEAPTGDIVTIWSIPDLAVDRLAQAVFDRAEDRLFQALALRRGCARLRHHARPPARRRRRPERHVERVPRPARRAGVGSRRANGRARRSVLGPRSVER